MSMPPAFSQAAFHVVPKSQQHASHVGPLTGGHEVLRLHHTSIYVAVLYCPDNFSSSCCSWHRAVPGLMLHHLDSDMLSLCRQVL